MAAQKAYMFRNPVFRTGQDYKEAAGHEVAEHVSERQIGERESVHVVGIKVYKLLATSTRTAGGKAPKSTLMDA